MTPGPENLYMHKYHTMICKFIVHIMDIPNCFLETAQECNLDISEFWHVSYALTDNFGVKPRMFYKLKF